MQKTWKLLIYGISIYVAICLYVYFNQSNIIFYPDIPHRSINTTPDSINLDYENIEFYTSDNIKLHGWFIPHQHARFTLLFFHGNAGNISHRLRSIKIFHQLYLNVFIIDYRGYGQSEGEITEDGTYLDAEAALNYLSKIKQTNEKDIIIFGRSLGASVASKLASKHTPGALIIESGFSSVSSMGQRLYPFLPVRWLTRYQYNTAEHVKQVNSPILVAHSRDDNIIPYIEGRDIFNAASEPKIFLEMRGGHNNGFIKSGHTYINGLEAFINTLDY